MFSIEDDDYVPATIEVQFQMAPNTMCRLFTVLEDTEKEPVEAFGILLETSDPAVQLTDTFASVSINDSTGMYKKYLWLLTDSSAHLMDIYRLVSMHLLLIAVTRVGFDPVMYTVNETEGIVTVCISAMDTLTGGTLSVILTTESGTASGMFIQSTCPI